MKNHLTLLFFTLLIGVSCSKERTIEEDLIGDWIYERTYYKEGSTYNDTDTKGIITFNEDETGNWMRINILNINTPFEWDMQDMDRRIAISKNLNHVSSSQTNTKVYELRRNGIDQLTLTYEIYSFQSMQLIES